MPFSDAAAELTRLLTIMERLRSPSGCPWDAEQTTKSLRRYLIEECYEVLEAIDQEDTEEICDELGDLLLQIVFHAQIFREQGDFDIKDVISGIADKLVRRHPHVFAEQRINSQEELTRQWEAIKVKEKKEKKVSSRFGSIPPHLPALARAHKLGEKAQRLGLDSPLLDGTMAALHAQLAQIEESLIDEEAELQQVRIGEALFAMSQLARRLGIEPEEALRQTVNRHLPAFESRVEEEQKG
ncbi:MAG: nucleoside triphosphate pyrophosphohydrolase [Desulfuromonas sp.]|nr:MAG: nucleoside triphosphate pyrophosphohydrolase [Desulfuromonas sp.]